MNFTCGSCLNDRCCGFSFGLSFCFQIENPGWSEEVYHAVEVESYSLQDQRTFLKGELTVGERSSFVNLMTGKTKPFVITTFLAILEMARLAEIDIFIGSLPNDFDIELTGLEATIETDSELNELPNE